MISRLITVTYLHVQRNSYKFAAPSSLGCFQVISGKDRLITLPFFATTDYPLLIKPAQCLCISACGRKQKISNFACIAIYFQWKHSLEASLAQGPGQQAGERASKRAGVAEQRLAENGKFEEASLALLYTFNENALLWQVLHSVGGRAGVAENRKLKVWQKMKFRRNCADIAIYCQWKRSLVASQRGYYVEL